MEQLEQMIGKIFTNVTSDNNELHFSNEVEAFRFHHYQDCCEDVYIEAIVGDLSDLVGTPILMAEVSSNLSSDDYGDEEWTFYKFATIKGYVDVTWRGSSNGYYSTSVSMDHSTL